jgi:hypothetical protein
LSTRNFIFCLWEHPSKMVISFLGSLPHRIYHLQPRIVKDRLVLRATTFVQLHVLYRISMVVQIISQPLLRHPRTSCCLTIWT